MTLDLHSFQILLQNNLEVKIQQVEVEKSSKKTSWARYYIPKVYAFSGIENEKSSSSSHTQSGAGLGFSLNLFSGGKDYQQFKIDQINYRQEVNQKELVSLKVLKKFRANYYDLLLALESQKIYQDYEKFNAENITLVKRKVASGLISATELLEYNLIDSEIDEQMLVWVQKERLAKAEMTLALDNNELQFHPNPNVLDSGLGGHKSKKIIELYLEQEGLEVDKQINYLAQKKALTNLHIDLFGEYSLSSKHMGEVVDDATSADSVFGVKVTWDIWDEGNKRSIESAEQLLEIERKRLQNRYDLRQREIDIEKKKFEIEALAEQIRSAQEKSKILSEIYRNTLTGFKNGTKESGDLRESTKKVIENKLQLLSLKTHKLNLEDELNF